MRTFQAAAAALVLAVIIIAIAFLLVGTGLQLFTNSQDPPAIEHNNILRPMEIDHAAYRIVSELPQSCIVGELVIVTSMPANHNRFICTPRKQRP